MKKLVIVFFSLAIVLGLSSCSNSIDESETLDANTTWEVINWETETLEPATEELTVEPETEPVATEPATTGALGQDLSVFEVKGGVEDEVVYLERNGVLYSLRREILMNGLLSGYYYNWISEVEGKFFSVGEVPILRLMRGDKIIVYSSSDVPEVSFVRVEDTGKWALGVVSHKDNPYVHSLYFYNVKDGEKEADFKKANNGEIIITDSNGKVCENYYDVEGGKDYVASWFVGTQYHETILNSNNHLYICDKDNAVSMSWSLTKNGYAEYDWSSISSGLYVFCLDSFWKTIVVEIP